MGKYNDVIKIFAESYLESNKFEIEGMEYVCELTPENELNVYINNPNDLSYSRVAVTGFFDELIDEFTKFLPKEKPGGPSAYFYMTKLVNYYTDISKYEAYISPKDKTELLKIANDIKEIKATDRDDYIAIRGKCNVNIKDIEIDSYGEGIEVTVEADCSELEISVNMREYVDVSTMIDHYSDIIFNSRQDDYFSERVISNFDPITTYLWNLKTLCDNQYMWVDIRPIIKFKGNRVY